MPRSQESHDIYIAGTGFMLAYNQSPDELDTALSRAAPAEQKANVDYPAARQSSGEQGYQDWPIEKEAPWLVSDLSGGFGHHMWEPGSNTYWYAFVDGRIPGKVLLPPERKRTTTNGETRLYCEFQRTINSTARQFGAWGRYIKYWTDPATLTDSIDLGTGIRPLSAASFQGAHDTLLTYVAVETTSDMPQPYYMYTGASVTTTWNRDTQRTNVTPLAGVYDNNGTFTEDAADPIALTLGGLQATEDAVYVRDFQPFDGVRFTMTTDENAAASVVSLAFWNGSAWTTCTGSTDNTIVAGASLGQTGNISYTLPTTWVPNAVNGTTGYHLRLTWSANLSATVGVSDVDLIQRDTAMFFAVHKAILYRVVRSGRGFELWSNAAGGPDATWTNVGTISDLSVPVTGIFSVSDDLWITTTGLPRILASGETTLSDGVWPHPRTLTDSLNGIGGNVWRGALWVPARQDLYRLFANTNGIIQIDDEVGPGRILDNDSPVSGRVTAFVGDDYYGYAVLQDRSNVSYLISWVPSTGKWHSLLNLGSGRCLKMWVSGVGNADGNPHLYMNMDTDLVYFVLPRNGPDPTSDPNCSFDNGTTDVGILLHGRFRSGFKYDSKVWLKGETEADSLAAGQTILYAYRTTTGAGFTNLTSAWASGTINSANFPTSVSGYWIEPRLTLATTAIASSPILRSFWLSYAVQLPQKPEYSFLLEIKDGLKTRSGTESRTAEQLLDALDTAMSASGTVTIFEPDLNASNECVPQPQLARRLKRRQTSGQHAEYLYLAVFTQHQATVLGTWNRMASGIWSSYSSRTWADMLTV